MKNIKKLIILLVLPVSAWGQEQASEEIQKSFHFTNPQAVPKIYVRNIQGSVTIEGYNGSEVTVDVKKTISGKTKEGVSRGMDEVELGVWQNGDSLAVYMNHKTLTRFSVENGKVEYRFLDCDCDRYSPVRDFDPTFVFTIRVPANSFVDARTVNHGQVSIKNVKGMVSAYNVNGAINVNDIVQIDHAETVNGNVNVTYDANGVSGGIFRTINGNININFPRQPNAEVSFKSMNGNLYTNVDELVSLQPELKKTRSSKGSATIYKIEKVTPVRFGKGGARMTFETLNGDVLIKKEL